MIIMELKELMKFKGVKDNSICSMMLCYCKQYIRL